MLKNEFGRRTVFHSKYRHTFMMYLLDDKYT